MVYLLAHPKGDIHSLYEFFDLKKVFKDLK